jgi:hypothetical protein
MMIQRIMINPATINVKIVIPAKAGIQENQRHGHRPAPV